MQHARCYANKMPLRASYNRAVVQPPYIVANEMFPASTITTPADIPHQEQVLESKQAR